MDLIKREDVLNCPLEFRVNGEREAALVKGVLQAVMDYVRLLPAENDEAGTRNDEAEKKPVRRRKKA